MEDTQSGDLRLLEDGSFTYSPWIDSIESSDRFSYITISDDGTSEVRTATIEGKQSPVLELKAQAVNSSGELISSVEVGEEFFLEVTGNFRRYSPARGIKVRVVFNADTVDPSGDILFKQAYYAEHLEIVTAPDDKLSLVPTIRGPDGTFGPADITADVRGFSSNEIDTEIEIFRVPFVATETGETEFVFSDVAFDSPSELVRRLTTSLTILPAGTALATAVDVNGDGFATPLDALLVINLLNQSNGPIRLEEHVSLDVNGDNFITPLDALLVINYVNSVSSLAINLSGEGEGPVFATARRSGLVEDDLSPLVAPIRSSPIVDSQARQIDYPRLAAQRSLITDLSEPLTVEEDLLELLVEDLR